MRGQVGRRQTAAQRGRKYDLGNLQALCRGCHIRKTAREDEAVAACLYPQKAAWTGHTHLILWANSIEIVVRTKRE